MAEPPVRRPPAAGASPAAPSRPVSRPGRSVPRTACPWSTRRRRRCRSTRRSRSRAPTPRSSARSRRARCRATPTAASTTRPSHAYASAVAELEGAEAGFAFGSGMAAIHAAIGTLVSAGDRIVASRSSYGTTRSQLASVFMRLGVRTEFVDVTDLAAVEAALAAGADPDPLCRDDLEPDDRRRGSRGTRRARPPVRRDLRRRQHVRLAVSLPADRARRRPRLRVRHEVPVRPLRRDGRASSPAPSPRRPRSATSRSTREPASIRTRRSSAMRGLSTLALRMERHSATAGSLARLARGPARRDAGSGTRRSASHPQHERRRRASSRAAAGCSRSSSPAGRAAGEAFIDTLTIPERTASLGSVFTIVSHPPSTTHRQLDDAALAAAGITPGLLRCSVGLEDLDDLVADFETRARRRARGRGHRRPPRSRQTPNPPGGRRRLPSRPPSDLRRNPRSPAP